ncbi:TIGR04086 family membrane protein (plasmid) [Ewingella americana]|nr:TIGR04086 family membrane protein [Ewingella americana]
MPLKRISWSAIFAGVIISIVVYLLLSILGTAVGASTIDPLKEQNPLDHIGTGALIWTGLSMLISIAAGGYASGRLAQREGALHGVLMFGVNTLISLWFLVVVVNSAVSGAASVVGSGLQTLGSGISAAAPPVTQMVKDKLGENNINLDSLQNELETTLRQTGKPELQPENLQNKAEGEVNNAQNQAANTANHPQTADTDVVNFIKGLVQRNESTFQAADRDALKNIIKARTGKSDQEVEQIVAQTEKSYQQARAKYEELKQQAEQKAREAADKAAAATAKASWFAFFLLIVEAVLAGAMGALGRRTQPRAVFSDQRPLR